MLLAASAQGADAETSPIAAEYDVFAGGMHVMTSDLEISLDDDSYNARLGAEMVGMAGWFVEWSAVVQTGGTIKSGELDPTEYYTQRFRRGESQKTMLDFSPDGDIGVTFEPERSDSDGLVPTAMLAESLDPLSGLVSVINTVTQGGNCDATVPVFDGRRRYDLQFTDMGMVDLSESSKSAYAGPARRCRMKLEPVAGAFKDDDGKGFWSRRPESERRRQLDIWLAQPIDGGPIMPVRMIGRSAIGAIVIHLREAHVTVATADADAPEECSVAVTC